MNAKHTTKDELQAENRQLQQEVERLRKTRLIDWLSFALTPKDISVSASDERLIFERGGAKLVMETRAVLKMGLKRIEEAMDQVAPIPQWSRSVTFNLDSPKDEHQTR